MTEFPNILSYTSTNEIPVPEDWEKYPFRAEPPRTGHYRECSSRPQERDYNYLITVNGAFIGDKAWRV